MSWKGDKMNFRVYTLLTLEGGGVRYPFLRLNQIYRWILKMLQNRLTGRMLHYRLWCADFNKGLYPQLCIRVYMYTCISVRSSYLPKLRTNITEGWIPSSVISPQSVEGVEEVDEECVKERRWSIHAWVELRRIVNCL